MNYPSVPMSCTAVFPPHYQLSRYQISLAHIRLHCPFRELEKLRDHQSDSQQCCNTSCFQWWPSHRCEKKMPRSWYQAASSRIQENHKQQGAYIGYYVRSVQGAEDSQ